MNFGGGENDPSLFEQNISWGEYLDKIANDNTLIGRFASPEEVANLFVFYALPAQVIA
jgi:NAD(P)-dependent dehydrogenase (short-subunit alcohol dehydrogenase family)